MSTKETQTIYTDFTLEVSFTLTKGRPAKMHLPNGDPGYPEDPDEFEVDEVWAVGGDGTRLFQFTIEQIKKFDFDLVQSLSEAYYDSL